MKALLVGALVSTLAALPGVALAQAQVSKPNIILILSDDFGYGDAGAYGGGPGRGMPTPNLDRLAADSMTFFSNYAQPSCTPGRAAVQTFAAMAGVKLPEKDREGQPIIFDSYDLTPVLMGKAPSPRKEWFYFTENELSPGAVRVGNFKAAFNLRGDDGAHTGGLAVDSNLGWKGAEKYVATVPQVFDLLQDPQERYDLFMNNFTERTWTMVPIGTAIEKLMKTYVWYPPRKLQSMGYDGPIELSKYQKFQWAREQLQKGGINIPMPTGN